MHPQRRRWCCPLCGVEYYIPVALDDPMACPACTGETGASEIWFTSSDAPVSPVQGAAAPEAELWVTALQEEPAPPAPAATIDSAVVERIVAESEARRRRRRAVLLAATAVVALAAVGTLAALRPYEFREILKTPPSVRGNPVDEAPLVAIVEFSTELPAIAAVIVNDGERSWTCRSDAEPNVEHRLALVGLRPDRAHRIRVRVESSDGWFVDESEAVTLTTPPLPDDFPPLRTDVSQPARMEPGLTLFGVNRWVQDVRDYQYGYLIMLNAKGEVVWYFRSQRGTADLRMLPNGHLLCNNTSYRQVYEIDLLGNLVREWQATGLEESPKADAIPVEVDTFHHEVLRLPSGNFLALSTELRELEEYPTSETDPDSPPGPAVVVGDVIVEFQPDDGTVVRRLKLHDIFDSQRIAYGSLTSFWNKTYAGRLDGDSQDWSHSNAITYDPRDDSLLLSIRHQDCLVKMDRESGRIDWILGDHQNWREPWSKYLLEPRGDLQWFYHQHGPQRTPSGTILMYDNGNYRALPFDPPTPGKDNYSRIVEFRIDEKQRTVEQVWEYRGDESEPFYCPFYGEADLMPNTGNLLITDGGHIEMEDGTPSDVIPSDYQWARIFEITRSQPPEKVFEVVLDSGLGSPLGWSVYRSERLPDVQALSDLATAHLND